MRLCFLSDWSFQRLGNSSFFRAKKTTTVVPVHQGVKSNSAVCCFHFYEEQHSLRKHIHRINCFAHSRRWCPSKPTRSIHKQMVVTTSLMQFCYCCIVCYFLFSWAGGRGGGDEWVSRMIRYWACIQKVYWKPFAIRNLPITENRDGLWKFGMNQVGAVKRLKSAR